MSKPRNQDNFQIQKMEYNANKNFREKELHLSEFKFKLFGLSFIVLVNNKILKLYRFFETLSKLKIPVNKEAR